MGFRVTRGGISHASKLLDHKQGPKAKKGPMPTVDPALRKQIITAADNLFAGLTKHFHSKQYNVRFQCAWEGRMLDNAKVLAAHLGDGAKQLYEAAGLSGITPERAQELHNMAARCADHGKNIIRIAEFESEGWVFFLDEEGDRVVMKGSPVSVAAYLRDNLFEYKKGEFAVESVTVTSATLATTRDDYSFISDQLGLKGAEELTVESPFNIEENMLVVCPAMPSVKSDRFVHSLAERILDVLDEVGGRTLCLFTSYRNMHKVYDLVQRQSDYPLMKQGEAPRTQLIERFKKHKESVLFGTESFWAGVDVPGDSLSCVVIDKLPFPNISDPLQDVLKSKYGSSYFGKVSIPQAVIAFRQGAGRLLRTDTDRGAIVILDSRVTEKGYGKKFTRSFPQGTRIVRDLAHIGPFVRGED